MTHPDFESHSQRQPASTVIFSHKNTGVSVWSPQVLRKMTLIGVFGFFLYAVLTVLFTVLQQRQESEGVVPG